MSPWPVTRYSPARPDRLHHGYFVIELRERGAGMHMRIHEAWHEQLSTEVHHLGLRVLQREHRRIRAHRRDFAISNGDGLMDGEALIHGDDLAVMKDQRGAGGEG